MARLDYELWIGGKLRWRDRVTIPEQDGIGPKGID